MTCPFCAHSTSENPNCAHVLLNAVRIPAFFITPATLESYEMGHRAHRSLAAENTGSRIRRELHIRKVSQ